MVGRDTDLQSERTVLATFPGGCCLVKARTDEQVTTYVREQLGYMNGNIRLHNPTPNEVFELEQRGVKTYLVLG